jgi:HK97 family phage portal protein
VGIFVDAIELRSLSLENPATSLSDPAAWLFEAFGAAPTDAGVVVSPQSALKYTAVWACVQAIAQDTAQVPWDVYRLNGKRTDVASDRSEHYLLHCEPNGKMTSYGFRVALLTNMLLYGAGFAELVRDGAGRVKAIRHLPSWNVRVFEHLTEDRLVYEVTRNNGVRDVLDGSDVIHVPCISLDGMAGLSPISQHREAIALGLSAERMGAAFFGNSARPSGYLSCDATSILKKEQRQEVAEAWRISYSGSENTGKIPVLTGGMKWNPLSIPPNDAQFLETRDFQVLDMARMYNVPAVRIGVHEKASSYASVEQFLLSYSKFTMMPHYQNIEQEFNRKLFPNTTDLYCKLDARGLMRGDSAARASFYKSMFEVGAFSSNDILAFEDMNPVEGGDRHFVQQNLMPVDKVDEVLSKKAAQQPSDKQARSAHVSWLRDVAGRVAKWEKRDSAKVVDALVPVFESLDGGDLRNVRAFCEGLVPSIDVLAERAGGVIQQFLESK